MIRKCSEKLCLSLLFLLSLPVLLAGATSDSPESKITAAQVADRNAIAHGGLQAWMAVQTISYAGKLEAGGKEIHKMENGKRSMRSIRRASYSRLCSN